MNSHILPAIYLDIDGVLLTKKQQLPEGGAEFLDFALRHFDCYWLTTHCKGQAQTALRYLSTFYPMALLEKLKAVKPTDWDALKTDGIALDKDFYWLDDYPFEAEKAVLKAHNKLDRLVLCDLNRMGELGRIHSFLQAQCSLGKIG